MASTSTPHGVLWASLDYVPNAIRPTDLLRLDTASGRGTLTATLALVDNTGARGLAIAPPPCSGALGGLPGARPIPALGWPWLVLFGAAVLTAALRRVR
ncbi:MAG: hypothetical protein RML12_00125 [Xanthomonadales bacterium]|nr:hypothetical protein [Xanthomonadales bacterium]